MLFGPDTTSQADPDALRERLLSVVRVTISRLRRVSAEIGDLGRAGVELTIPPVLPAVSESLATSVGRLVEGCTQLEQRDVGRPFRVVLMGQTTAGKSTLFRYLTGMSETRIGDGRQRTTREISIGTVADLDIEVVDTPGVGAMDGQVDFDMAFTQVADADLILWVAPTFAAQLSTGLALEQLADLGKPILVALNCRHDISTEIGLLDMLEEPDLVFSEDALRNLAPITRFLSLAGGRFIRAVPIHAQAALRSATHHPESEESRTLHENSRIDDLVQELLAQRDRTAELRRLVSIGDFVRIELLEASSSLASSILLARASLAACEGNQRDFARRAERRVADAHTELQSAFGQALAARERWIERVDVDQSDRALNSQWELEIIRLREEVARDAAAVGERLEHALRDIAIDVAQDWSQVQVEGFRDLIGRGAIWGNRLIKVGGRFAVGAAGLVAGTKLGAVAGTFFGPGPGNVIGAVAGALFGLIAGLLGADRAIDWVGDRVFRNSAEVHERRRQRVREQLSQRLTEVREKLFVAEQHVRDGWLESVAQANSRHVVSTGAARNLLIELESLAALHLEPALARVDADIARELLSVLGRGRAAAALTHATRWRGAGMAVELPEPAFSELVLFPLDSSVECIVPTAQHSMRSTSALQIIRSLTDHEVTIHEMMPDSLRVSLASPVVPGVREAWESLAFAHTGLSTQIQEPLEGDTP